MAAKKHDWIKIRTEFVTGPITLTLDKVAKNNGVTPCVLRLRAAKEKWTQERKRYHTKLATEAEKIATKTQAKRLARQLTIADSMKALGAEALRRTIKDFDGDAARRLNLDELRLLIKDATEIERRALGMPDAVMMTGKELDDRLLGILSELDAESED
jgi:hypothetical protein